MVALSPCSVDLDAFSSAFLDSAIAISLCWPHGGNRLSQPPRRRRRQAASVAIPEEAEERRATAMMTFRPPKEIERVQPKTTHTTNDGRGFSNSTFPQSKSTHSREKCAARARARAPSASASAGGGTRENESSKEPHTHAARIIFQWRSRDRAFLQRLGDGRAANRGADAAGAQLIAVLPLDASALANHLQNVPRLVTLAPMMQPGGSACRKEVHSPGVLRCGGSGSFEFGAIIIQRPRPDAPGVWALLQFLVAGAAGDAVGGSLLIASTVMSSRRLDEEPRSAAT